MNNPSDSFLKKQEELKKIFYNFPSSEAKYTKLIELGRSLPPFNPQFKTAEAEVQGCQSKLYLHTRFEDGNLFFEASSEALISLGLAAALIYVYNGESPEVILTCPPHFIEEMGIRSSLTPGRSNGLSSMYLRMQQEALKFLRDHV